MRIIPLFFCCISFVLFSCKEKAKPRFTDTYTTGVIPIAVDENFRPIIQEEIDVFESIYTKSGIVPIFTDEVDAINRLLKDSVRFAIATRTLSNNEKKSMNSRKLFPREIKLAVDGIALIVHPSNKDTIISVDDLRKIFAGDAKNWKDIFPKSKLGNFTVVFDNPNSSSIRYAIDSICKGGLLSKELNAQKTNLEVINYVSHTPNAIGIIGVNWLGNKKDTTNLTFKNNVRVMSVSKDDPATTYNSYKPYQAYLFYGNYPLARSVYIILNDPRSALPSGLATFMTSDRGQRIILKSGLVPATQPIRVVNVKDQR